MGVLLTFMFVWNMVGALILLPALAYFLLPHRKACTEQLALPAHKHTRREHSSGMLEQGASFRPLEEVSHGR
ncbi:hypothetical protein D3C80_1015800 [compost metagenome]